MVAAERYHSWKPRVTVALGPGAHTQELVAELARRSLLQRVIRSWPEFAIDHWNTTSGTLERLLALPAYAHLVRAVWATWRRTPRLGRHRTPQTFLFSVFDHLAARHLGDPDLFVGWSQHSLHSMRAAKRHGAVAVLEHPMVHVQTWQETMGEEYARYSPNTAEFYSLFPKSLVKRMLAEYKEADHIVVPSTVVRDSFLRCGAAHAQLVDVAFGVDTTYFATIDRRPTDRFRVLFLGRLELLKGPQYLLEAWARLRLKEATLTLVGRVLPEVHDLLSAAMSFGNIEVLGPLPREGARNALQDSDVVVFPSICDAFGLVILEAMASGRPVIATSRSAGPDVITEGVDGFVVPPRDAKAIADRLEWLYSHRQERTEMGRNARLKIEGRYDMASYGERLRHAYMKMAARGRSPQRLAADRPGGR